MFCNKPKPNGKIQQGTRVLLTSRLAYKNTNLTFIIAYYDKSVKFLKKNHKPHSGWSIRYDNVFLVLRSSAAEKLFW